MGSQPCVPNANRWPHVASCLQVEEAVDLALKADIPWWQPIDKDRWTGDAITRECDMGSRAGGPWEHIGRRGTTMQPYKYRGAACTRQRCDSVARTMPAFTGEHVVPTRLSMWMHSGARSPFAPSHFLSSGGSWRA